MSADWQKLTKRDVDFTPPNEYYRFYRKEDLLVGLHPHKHRCFIASRDYEPGEVVMSEEAMVWVPRYRYKEVTCVYCGKLCLQQVFKDRNEDIVGYCSLTCSQADRAVRERERALLPLIERLSMHEEEDPVRLIVRLLCHQSATMEQEAGNEEKKEEKKEEKEDSSSSSFLSSVPDVPLDGSHAQLHDVLSLVTNKDQFSGRTQLLFDQAGETLETVFSSEPSSFHPKLFSELSSDLLVSLLFIIQCNAHGLQFKDQEVTNFETLPLGLGLFPLSAMINHSDTPNTTSWALFEENSKPRYVFRAIRSIKRGEEVTHAYIDLYNTPSERSRLLREVYAIEPPVEKKKKSKRVGQEQEQEQEQEEKEREEREEKERKEAMLLSIDACHPSESLSLAETASLSNTLLSLLSPLRHLPHPTPLLPINQTVSSRTVSQAIQQVVTVLRTSGKRLHPMNKTLFVAMSTLNHLLVEEELVRQKENKEAIATASSQKKKNNKKGKKGKKGKKPKKTKKTVSAAARGGQTLRPH